MYDWWLSEDLRLLFVWEPSKTFTQSIIDGFVSIKFVKMSCRLVVEFSTLTGISSDDRKYLCVEFMHKYTMCRIKWRYKWSSHFKSTVVSFLRLSFSTYYLIYVSTLFIALFFSISLLFLFFLRRPNDTWKRQMTIV